MKRIVVLMLSLLAASLWAANTIADKLDPTDCPCYDPVDANGWVDFAAAFDCVDSMTVNQDGHSYNLSARELEAGACGRIGLIRIPKDELYHCDGYWGTALGPSCTSIEVIPSFWPTKTEIRACVTAFRDIKRYFASLPACE